MDKKSAIGIFLAVIMVGSILPLFFSGSFNNNSDRSNSFTDAPGIDTIPGNKVRHRLNSITDGLSMSPEGITSAQYVDFIKVYNSQLQMFEPNATQMSVLYNTGVTKQFTAIDNNIEDGPDAVIEMHTISPEIVNFKYVLSKEPYNGYYFLSRGNNYFNVVGSPMLLGTDKRLKEVIDVISGTAESSKDFDYLLSNVDPGAEIQIVSSDNELIADQYYLEFRALEDKTYARTALYLNLNQSVLAKLNSLAENSSNRGLEYDIVKSDNITKVMVKANESNLFNLAFEPYS
ncbi:hypothetical protein [Methanomethylovorans sp.]|uniref:hypothetical protein n=1 Tax=Methanomethylovorans sp. TaxID=2758717 RepID=UPI000A944B84|nr:hypothetical protein [Methanomethylovorans sp.]